MSKINSDIKNNISIKTKIKCNTDYYLLQISSKKFRSFYNFQISFFNILRAYSTHMDTYINEILMHKLTDPGNK